MVVCGSDGLWDGWHFPGVIGCRIDIQYPGEIVCTMDVSILEWLIVGWMVVY